MNVTPIHVLLLSAAMAVPTATPMMLAAGVAPPKVCVLTGAGTGCEVPRPGAHALRPLEL